jgi:hypothetical protein
MRVPSPSFPGFDEPLAEGEIICSCPITTADSDQATFGYQIVGPFPCEDSFFENCSNLATNRRTGSTIPVGAPTGDPRLHRDCSMARCRRSTCARRRAATEPRRPRLALQPDRSEGVRSFLTSRA